MSSFTLSSPRVANYQTSASALRVLTKLMAVIAVSTTIAALLGGCASRQAISTDYGSRFSMRGDLLASEQPSSLLPIPVDDNAGLKTAPWATQAASGTANLEPFPQAAAQREDGDPADVVNQKEASRRSLDTQEFVNALGRKQDDNRWPSLLLVLGGMCAGPFALLYR